jgi:glycosyltransferase involved in cell wall biosynthesis
MILAVIQWCVLPALALTLVVWVVRAAIILMPSGAGPRADRLSCRDVPDVGLVSVIIPAKDEEANIETALASVLAQDYPHLEVIVVDDRSADRTAEAVGRAAAGDGRVRLLRVDSLPQGWRGKPHALHVGVGAARGRWLLFVDADCRLAPHAVRAGLGLLAAEKADLFTLWPAVESEMLWLCEDMALAHRVKAAGGRVLASARHDLLTTRMYNTFAATFRGWTRIYCGCFQRVGRLAPILGTLLVFSFWTIAVLALGAAALVATAVALRQVYLIMRQEAWYGLLCPAAAVVLVGVLLAAMAHAAGLTPLTWRGTTYRQSSGGAKS